MLRDWLKRLCEPLTFVTLLLFCATFALYWATRELVRGTEETAERQLRAYVGTISNIGMSADGTRLMLDNFGLTPATDVKVFSNWKFLPFGQELPATVLHALLHHRHAGWGSGRLCND